MSDTHRAHLPASRHARRGPTNRARLAAAPAAPALGGVGYVKPQKQIRANVRIAIRKGEFE